MSDSKIPPNIKKFVKLWQQMHEATQTAALLFYWPRRPHCMKSSTVDDSIKTLLSPYMAKLIVLFLSYLIEFYKSTLINILFAIKITELSGTFLEIHDLFVLSSTESLPRLTSSLLSLSRVHKLRLRQPTATAETSSSDTLKDAQHFHFLRSLSLKIYTQWTINKIWHRNLKESHTWLLFSFQMK